MTELVDTVRVEGSDAASYLQGQLSQDVEAMAVGDQAWSFVLSPTGRIDAFVLVRRQSDDAFGLDVDAGFGEALSARLSKFLLRTKAAISVSAASAVDDAADDDVERIVAGRPAMGKDIDERSVPAEVGWLERAVSFTKGCYVGQELVARMDSRVAEPPRRLVRLSIDGVASAGDEVAVDAVAAGVITSAARTDDKTVALAYLKRGTALDGRVSVGGLAARVDGLAGA